MITIINNDSLDNINKALRYREEYHEELIECMQAYIRLENGQELKAFVEGSRLQDCLITPDIRKAIMRELEDRINILRERLSV